MADTDKQQDFLAQNGLHLLTPDKEDSPVPQNVDPLTGEVRFSTECPFPMRWDGYSPQGHAHSFARGRDAGDCFCQHHCPKERLIPLDRGLFRPIPNWIPESEKATELRKVAERPFNLMKHMDGLEPCRMKTMSTISAQVCFSQLVGIFKVLAGLRSVKKEARDTKTKTKQMPLKLECG